MASSNPAEARKGTSVHRLLLISQHWYELNLNVFSKVIGPSPKHIVQYIASAQASSPLRTNKQTNKHLRIITCYTRGVMQPLSVHDTAFSTLATAKPMTKKN
jgi:hypothetical protein